MADKRSGTGRSAVMAMGQVVGRSGLTSGKRSWSAIGAKSDVQRSGDSNVRTPVGIFARIAGLVNAACLAPSIVIYAYTIYLTKAEDSKSIPFGNTRWPIKIQMGE